ncbi:MAG: zf-HC2 domain-containing protein [Akkermansiaceae bacterium]|nr:zf-HC2 domain-containing protein [Armatimonadota bacterium]
METSRFRDNLSDYIENRLPAGARGEVDAHLAASPEAQSDLADLKEVWQGLDSWAKTPDAEPPMFFRDNVLSAVERTGTRRGYWNGESRAKSSVWERLFPNAGRLVFAAGVGGVVAVAGFLVATDALNPVTPAQLASVGTPLSRVASGLVLPYAGQVVENDTADVAPRLVISTGRTLTPDAHTVCDFTFWLENAPQGSARFTVVGESTVPGVASSANKTFNYAGISGSAAQTLRVPFDAQKPSALTLKVRWTAIGSAHERYLFVPTSSTAITESASFVPPPPFTTSEMPLLDALQQVATVTSTPITLEDAPGTDALRVRVSADGKESVSVALRRSLSPLGLRVSRSPAGILITKQ